MSRVRTDEKRAELVEQLYGHVLPSALAYLWRIYWQLRRRKGGSGFGASPIEWPDIAAYVQHSGVRLAPWEVDLLCDVDDLYMAEQVTAAQRERGG